MEHIGKIYSFKTWHWLNIQYVQLLSLLQFWLWPQLKRARRHSSAWHNSSVYNETQHDSSQDELYPTPSELESENGNEDQFFPEFLCNYTNGAYTMDTYSSLHQP